MSLRGTGARLCALLLALAAIVPLFKAWMTPANLPLWLGGWIAGLCT
jgi:hypothetical protein